MGLWKSKPKNSCECCHTREATKLLIMGKTEDSDILRLCEGCSNFLCHFLEEYAEKEWLKVVFREIELSK